MSRTSAQIVEGESLLELSLKRCGKCANILHLESFYKGAGLGGYRPTCKPCMAVDSNAWRSANSERTRELERAPHRRENGRARKARYLERHRERLAAERAEWRKANPERVAELNRKARESMTEEARQRAREYVAQWRVDNPERYKAQYQNMPVEARRRNSNAWKVKNRERCRAYARERMRMPQAVLNNRVRARMRACLRNGWQSKKAEALGWSIAELRAHLERQFVKGMTWENMDKWHIDHIIPLSSFTFSDEADEEFRRAWALPNLRPLWAQDNMEKSDKVLHLL